MTEGEMAECHHWLNGHEFEQAPGVVMDKEAWRAAVHGLAHAGMHWSFMVVGVPHTLYVELLVLQLILRRESTEQADKKRKIDVE